MLGLAKFFKTKRAVNNLYFVVTWSRDMSVIMNKIEVKNMKTFLKLTNQNKLINDEFISFIIYYSRKKNHNSIIMKQPIKLPFSYTREDVLIEEI